MTHKFRPLDYRFHQTDPVLANMMVRLGWLVRKDLSAYEEETERIETHQELVDRGWAVRADDHENRQVIFIITVEGRRKYKDALLVDLDKEKAVMYETLENHIKLMADIENWRLFPSE